MIAIKEGNQVHNIRPNALYKILKCLLGFAGDEISTKFVLSQANCNNATRFFLSRLRIYRPITFIEQHSRLQHSYRG